MINAGKLLGGLLQGNLGRGSDIISRVAGSAGSMAGGMAGGMAGSGGLGGILGMASGFMGHAADAPQSPPVGGGYQQPMGQGHPQAHPQSGVQGHPHPQTPVGSHQQQHPQQGMPQPLHQQTPGWGSQPPQSPPPPPPGQPSSPPPVQSEALLLIRAMIAAANADGVIDAEERSRIFGKLEETGLNDEERNFIQHELANPSPPERILSEIRSYELAKQVYMVSLMAITVDTEAERAYMKNLAQHLGINQATLNTIHSEFGIGMF